MTTAKTDYHEQQVTDRVFANSAPDGAVDGGYVALWTSSPANAPDETNEVSGDSYSPVQVTASGWSTNSASNPRRYQNDSEVNFGVLDSSTSTTVEGYVLYDGPDSSTDNALYYNDDISESVDAGNELKFNAGDLTFGED